MITILPVLDSLVFTWFKKKKKKKKSLHCHAAMQKLQENLNICHYAATQKLQDNVKLLKQPAFINLAPQNLIWYEFLLS